MKINITSSMKYIDLQGLKPREIILKYEEMLYQRENTIKEITDQLTDSQQKLLGVNDKYQQLLTKNKELIESKSKYEKILNQQRTDKDLLFIKLNNLISENDKLKLYINGNTPGLKPHAQQQNTNTKKENMRNSMPNSSKKIEEKLKIENKIEIKNEKKISEEKKIENNKNNINDNVISTNDNKEKNIEKEKVNKKENKKEDQKKNENEDKKEESTDNNININSISENDTEKDKNTKTDKVQVGEIKSQSDKKLIIVNPEEYLARRKKKHKGPKKLLSEKVSYDPVFK